jgi:hypothetical protein
VCKANEKLCLNDLVSTVRVQALEEEVANNLRV